MATPSLFPLFMGGSGEGGGDGVTVMFEALSVQINSGTEQVSVIVDSGGDVPSVIVTDDTVVVTVEEDD